MPICGIVAQETEDVPVIPLGYTPQPVQFTAKTGFNQQCAIRRSVVTCTNNGLCSWAGWFRMTDWATHGAEQDGLPHIFHGDAASFQYPYWYQTGSTAWEAAVGNHSGRAHFIQTNTANLPGNTWINVICSVDVNQSAGNKKFRFYVNDVSHADTTGTDSGTAFQLDMNTRDFWLGDDSFGNGAYFKVADFGFWPGVSFLTAGDITQATRRLFIDDDGNPVDPLDTGGAIATFGTPAIMCLGGVSGFLANAHGSSGTLAVPAGYDTPLNTTW